MQVVCKILPLEVRDEAVSQWQDNAPPPLIDLLSESYNVVRHMRPGNVQSGGLEPCPVQCSFKDFFISAHLRPYVFAVFYLLSLSLSSLSSETVTYDITYTSTVIVLRQAPKVNCKILSSDYQTMISINLDPHSAVTMPQDRHPNTTFSKSLRQGNSSLENGNGIMTQYDFIQKGK